MFRYPFPELLKQQFAIICSTASYDLGSVKCRSSNESIHGYPQPHWNIQEILNESAKREQRSLVYVFSPPESNIHGVKGDAFQKCVWMLY